MTVFSPNYLNTETLPYVSDLLYHSRIIYFLPTGTHPLEFRNVLRFPRYCQSKSIELPAIIWNMCELYFVNSEEAAYCLKILEPLIGNAILVIKTVYPRDRAAIVRAKQMIVSHPSLSDAITHVELDPKFLAREFLSHILFEVYLENGIRGSIEYINGSCSTEADFQLTISSVLINRLNAIANFPYPVLLHEHSWNKLLQEHTKVIASTDTDLSNDQIDSFDIEHFKFKLFETLLIPLFGRCDSREKANLVARLTKDKQQEILLLKKECEHIAREVKLLPTKDIVIQQDVLRELIQRRIAEPLGSLLDQPRQDTLAFVRDVVLDSSVIAGLLGIFHSFDTRNLATAFASAVISAGTRLLLGYRAGHRIQASKLLIEGMRKNRISYLQLQEYLNSISMSQLTIPEELR